MRSGPANSNRSKWMLVAALGVVLVGVIVWQLRPSSTPAANSGDEGAAGDNRKEIPARRLPRRMPAQGVSLTATSHAAAAKWPTIPLAKIMAHDPFAPETLPAIASSDGASGDGGELAAQQERAAMLAETLEALRQRGVNMILHTSSGPVATIGDRMVKVGDTVGHYRVREIDADGVVLEAAPPK